MGQPVAFFEIVSPDHERAQAFYRDLFGWQVPHQVTGRQQLDSLVGVCLFASKGIFAELGDVAHRRSFLFQKERR